MAAALLSLPVVFSCLAALRWRLPIVLLLFIPTAAISDPYIAALILGVVLVIRYGLGQERVAPARAIYPMILGGVWVAYSIVLTPIGEPLGRWTSELLQLILGFLLFLAVVTSSLKRIDLMHISRGFLAAAIFLSVYAILLRTTGFSLTESGPLGPAQSNYSSIVIVIGLVCGLSGVHKSPASGDRTRFAPSQLLIAIVCLLGIFSNGSRASLLIGLLVVFLQYGLYRPQSFGATLRRLMLAVILFAGLVAALLVLFPGSELATMIRSTVDFSVNFSNLERFALMLASAQLFIDNPAGYGLGSSSELFANSRLTEGSYPHPHNTLAMFVVELGVVGLLIYIALIGSLISVVLTGLVRLRDAPCESRFAVCLAAALITATVYEAVFFNGSLAINIFAAIGLMFATKTMLRQTGTPSPGPNTSRCVE